MNVRFFPGTKQGRISVLCLIILILCVAFFFVQVNVFGQRGGDTFFSNLYLTIPMLAAWAAGVVSLVTGLTAIIKQKDKAVLVYISVVLSIFTTGYGLASIMG